MAINFTTFFTDAGLAFNAGNVNNTAASTTVPDEVEDYVQGVTGSIDIHKAVDRVPGAIAPYQSAAATLNDTVIRQSVRNLLVQMINDDKPQPSLTVSDAIEQLVDQMDNAAETVDKSVVACSSTYGSTMITTGTDDTSASAAFLTDTTASFRVNGLIGHVIYNVTDGSSGTVTANTATTVTATLSGGTEDDWDSGDAYSVTATAAGDGVIVCSTKRGDGKINEHILAELIEGTVTSTSTDGTGTLELQGEFLANSKMAVDWPKGSAVNSTVTSGAASGTNLINGTFEANDDESTDLPLGWINETGVLGTTIKLTSVEVTTIVMTGTPSAGSYTITFLDRDGTTQETVPLVYNATSSAVQTALNSLVGLESVTVAETGTTPNLTHTITCTGMKSSYDSGAPLSMFEGNNSTTGGTLTYAVPTTPGSPNTVRSARALEFDSSGAESTRIVYPLTSLTPGQQLAFNMWMLADVVPAAGVITVSLVDGIGGVVVADDEGTANTFTTAFGDWTTSFVAYNGVFRVPTTLPPVLYLRVEISTNISAGTSMFFDEMILKEMDQLYSGGPTVSAFSGRTDWALTDTATITTTNDRGTATTSGAAGDSLNEWMNRVFDLDTKNLLLPSSATPTQSGASLIS